MTLKSIHIQNIQSHSDTKIDLVPGVNIIIGQSRAGKSVLFRGLEKNIKNRPTIGLESWIHRHDPKNLISTSVETTDGHRVTWQGPKDQKYILDDEEFRGFGTEVPKPISEALNLADINMAWQFDQPYLLFDSPGQVAKTLNKIVHLDVIDRAMANVGSLKRANDQDIRVCEVRLGELRELESSFPDLVGAEEAVADLEDMQAEIRAKVDRLARLRAIQGQASQLRSRLEMIRLPAGVEDRLLELNQIGARKAQLEYTRALLLNLQGQVRGLMDRQAVLRPVVGQGSMVLHLIARANELEEKKTRLARTRGIQGQIKTLASRVSALRPIVDQERALTRLVAMVNELGAKRRILTRIRAMNEQVAGARLGINRKWAIIKAEEMEFKKLFPKKCPLCGR